MTTTDIAPYLLTSEQLKTRISRTSVELNELVAEEEKRKKWSPEFVLSIELHAALCNHRDCDFNYQFGPSGTTANIAEPSRYLGMATELRRKFNNEQIAEIVRIIHK
jgi:hypothetical protein